MVSELARGDFEDMQADGLHPTLDDFDRLNRLALRLTDGAETTAANFPRIGWAGDIPFFQPTCAAFSWYLSFVERSALSPATKDACWFYALAHCRDEGAFEMITSPGVINAAVTKWLSLLPVTREEIARACRYAATGFDDAQPGKTAAQEKKDTAKIADEKRDESLANLDELITTAAAASGIAPRELERETPSRLRRMIDAVRNLQGADNNSKSPLQADYDLAFREIRKRLTDEKAAKEAAQNGES